jgi:hypothetical protein
MMSITKKARATAMSIGFERLYGTIKKVPKKELGVHLSHCNQGEWEGVCKYGDINCPALRKGK